MLSRERRRQIARDFIIAISDRRLELNGSRWQQALGNMQEEVDAPNAEEIWVSGEWLALEIDPHLSAFSLDHATQSVIEGWSKSFRLSQILRYSVMPLRWEPLNYVSVHRGVSTAGGLFGTDVYLTGIFQDEYREFYLSSAQQKFFDIGPASSHGDNFDIQLTIGAALNRITPTYADFGLCLAGLESGMIAAQLFLLAQKLGLELSFIVPALPDRLPSQYLSSCIPMFTLSLRLDDDSPFDQMKQETVSGFIPSINPQIKHHMQALEQICEVGVNPIHGLCDEKKSRPFTDVQNNLFELTMRRSSGRVDTIGNSYGGITITQAQTLVHSALSLFSNLPVLAPSAKIITSLAICNSQLPEVSLYMLGENDGQLVEHICSPGAENAVRELCSGEFNIVVTIGADTCGMVDLISEGHILQLYAGAGLLGQCLSLAAAEIGAVARPYRALPDNEMNSLLPLNTRGLLQILIGHQQQPNLAFPL